MVQAKRQALLAAGLDQEREAQEAQALPPQDPAALARGVVLPGQGQVA